MSDGDPTFRTSSVRTGTDWWGRPTYDDDDRSGLPAGVHGSGSSDRYGANLSSAVAEANRRGDATLFSVRRVLRSDQDAWLRRSDEGLVLQRHQHG